MKLVGQQQQLALMQDFLLSLLVPTLANILPHHLMFMSATQRQSTCKANTFLPIKSLQVPNV
jgi:hypothetical protein